MGWFKDFVRVANGLTLVAKEAVSGPQGGSVSLLKRGLLSATDLAGLTKGKSHQYTPKIQKDHINNVAVGIDSNKIGGSKESVVFFKNEATATTHESHIQENEVKHVVIEPEGGNVEVTVSNEGKQDLGVEEMGIAPPPVQSPVSPSRKRKPRERKVPSTPFSRALG